MGLVVRISAYGAWDRTYFVQELDESEAKEKAFKAFKQTMSCYVPFTLEEFENDEGCFIEVVAEIEQIVL